MALATSMLLGIFDWVGDFFKSLFDLIPKVVYLLYASLACVIDVLQLFFRKLAGLDVYYVDGEAVAGDLVTNFITGILGINPNGFEYSALSTVFWSFIVFGIIICFASTIIAIVKSHYSYDDKAAKGPMQYVFTAGKAVLNMVAVPIIVVLGLYLSQAILTALDSMTSITSGNIVSMYGDRVELLRQVDTSKTATGLEESNQKNKTYIYYDIFGFGGAIAYGSNADATWLYADAKELALVGSSNQTFSGSLFKVAAYNANRVRTGTPMSALSGFGEKELFANAAIANDTELGADMIDTAFACNLHLNYTMDLKYITDSSDSNGVWTSFKYFTNFLTQNASAFSKFNIGLVWYYYDLWSFNFIVGFAACLVCATLFINIIMGLMARLFMCIALFLVAPPLFGLAPLDGGKAGGSWRENFMKQVLMAYGAVLGMNIMFLILPYINEIDFFNIAIADYFAQTLVIIVGLVTIKALIATLSGLIGGADANEAGGKIAEEVGSVAGKATKMTVGAVSGVARAPVNMYRGAAAIGNKIREARNGEGFGINIRNPFTGNTHFLGVRGRERVARDNIDDVRRYQRQRDALAGLDGRRANNIDRNRFIADYINNGGTRREANNLWRTVREEQQRVGPHGTVDAHRMRNQFGARNGHFNDMETTYSGAAGGRRLAAYLRTQNTNRQTAATLRADAHTRYQRNRSGLTELAGLVFSPFRNTHSVMDGNKFYSTFREKSFWPKADYQRQTAENTSAIRDNLVAGRADVRQGLETVNNNVQAGNNANTRSYRARVRMLTQEFVTTYGRNPNAAERRMINNRARAGATHL